jgi:tetratricopeptide (TPR) repeat protein
MKKLLFAITTVLVFVSCKTSKDYLSRSQDDKTLFDIVKQLNKRSDDANATLALPQVYTILQQKHLKNIEKYNNSLELNRWDKIASAYKSLQNIYDAIDNSTAASELLKAISYEKEIAAVKEAAAEDYYQTGLTYFEKNNREDARKAYTHFKKADGWIKGYKDTKAKMEEAFESSIVQVQINPVQDNSFFFNAGWGNTGYNFSNEYFQQNLIRDLGGTYASRYPAKFYTDWEARREDVKPDWVVDLVLRDIDIPRPISYSYSRNRSKQVEAGRDTSGKVIYKTVYATVNIERQSLTARGQMDVNITDVLNRKSIAYNSYSDTYNWQQEIATYTGDSRALTSSDWSLINNNYNLPRKEDILNELYRNIYPQVKNKISNEVDW